jgi:hypothetical protein
MRSAAHAWIAVGKGTNRAMAPGIRRVGDRVEVAYRDVVDFLDSPAGRRLRRMLAVGAIVGSKVLFRIPGLRRYPLIRALDRLGGPVLILRFARGLRDWEPSARRPVVVDLPPPPPNEPTRRLSSPGASAGGAGRSRA